MQQCITMLTCSYHQQERQSKAAAVVAAATNKQKTWLHQLWPHQMKLAKNNNGNKLFFGNNVFRVPYFWIPGGGGGGGGAAAAAAQ